MYADDSVLFQFLNQRVTWYKIKHFTNIKCYISPKSKTFLRKTSRSPKINPSELYIEWNYPMKNYRYVTQLFPGSHATLHQIIVCLTDLVILFTLLMLCLTNCKQFLTYFLIHIYFSFLHFLSIFVTYFTFLPVLTSIRQTILLLQLVIFCIYFLLLLPNPY